MYLCVYESLQMNVHFNNHQNDIISIWKICVYGCTAKLHVTLVVIVFLDVTLRVVLGELLVSVAGCPTLTGMFSPSQQMVALCGHAN